MVDERAIVPWVKAFCAMHYRTEIGEPELFVEVWSAVIGRRFVLAELPGTSSKYRQSKDELSPPE